MRHYMIPATMNPACRGPTPTPGKAVDVALAQPDGAAQAVELPLDAADRRRRGAQPPRESCAPSAGAGAPCAPGPWGGRPMRAGFRPPEPSGGFCRGRASGASIVGPHETVQAGICEPRGLPCLFTKTCARIKACACPQCAVARVSGSMTCSNFTADDSRSCRGVGGDCTEWSWCCGAGEPAPFEFTKCFIPRAPTVLVRRTDHSHSSVPDKASTTVGSMH